MKKIKATLCILCISIILFSFCSCSGGSDKKSTETYTGITEIADHLYLEKFDSENQSIFIGENPESVSRYIVKDAYIYKYACDGQRIAYHMNKLNKLDECDSRNNSNIRTINSTDYIIEKDVFVIADINTSKQIEFNSEDDFVSYCENNGYNLFNWKFTSGLEYDVRYFTNGWKLLTCESVSVTSQFIKNNKVMFEGFISDVGFISDATTNSNHLTFRLEIPETSQLEFPENYGDLISSDSPKVGKHRVGILLFENIYFDNYISINLNDGSFEVQNEK
ncbi:MAG: hypothetical protein NC122_08970 [Faecalibacterium sp.]|nr:hypothetical protein [Ruminococcus sp.]MCM1486326.1 hypothetical protein [Faecalibacterium sp.]